MFICALNSPSSIAGFFGLKVENCELLDYCLGVLCVLCSWKMGKQASKHGRYLEKARNVTSLYMCVYCVLCVCIPGIVHPSVGVAEETIGLWKGDTISLHCYRDKMVRCPAKEDGQLCCQF